MGPASKESGSGRVSRQFGRQLYEAWERGLRRELSARALDAPPSSAAGAIISAGVGGSGGGSATKGEAFAAEHLLIDE